MNNKETNLKTLYRNMKICHIVWGMSIGGTENMLIDIINKQIKEIDVILIVINNGYDKELLSRLDCRVILFLINRTPPKKEFLALIRLNYILLLHKTQIIHCHTPSLLGMILIRPLLSAKICITVHDTNIVYPQLYRYDKIFSISPSVNNDILLRNNLRSETIINGIDFDSVAKKTNITINTKSISIIQVSRLDHEKKGQELLLNALHKVVYKHKKPNIKVTFIGDGPSKDYLVNLAQSLKVYSYCKFLGSQNRDFVYATLKDYDLLVQPSYFEGFGLTVTEGIAAMLPVLVSDIEGPADIIQHGKYGYMFKKGDSESLAFKILQVMEDSKKPDFTNKMKINYEYAKRCFDVSNTAKSYIREYNKMFILTGKNV